MNGARCESRGEVGCVLASALAAAAAAASAAAAAVVVAVVAVVVVAVVSVVAVGRPRVHVVSLWASRGKRFYP